MSWEKWDQAHKKGPRFKAPITAVKSGGIEFHPAHPDSLPSYAEPATQEHLEGVKVAWEQMPKELRQQAEASRVAVGRISDTGRRQGYGAAAEGAVLLHPSDLHGEAKVARHELFHALLTKPVIDRVGGPRIWSDVRREGIPMPVHANRMYEQNGRDERAGADEFLSMLADEYHPDAEQHAQNLLRSPGVQAESYPGQHDYWNAQRWTEDHARKAVKLWRSYYGLK